LENKCKTKDLSDEAIAILIARSVNLETAVEHDGLVIEDESTVGMVERRVRLQNPVIKLDNSCTKLRRQINRNSIFDFVSYSRLRWSMSSAVSPDAVPPPNEW